MSECISYERDGDIAIVTLNRPEKRNAFTLEMLQQLALAYGRYARDRSARCMIVRGEGADFCSGLDLKSGADQLLSEGAAAFFSEGAIDPAGILTPRVEKPIVSAISGNCFTIGIEIAMAGDVIIAANNVKFAQLEVTRGILAFWGATVRMPQAVGWHNAMRWMLTGDIMPATEAYRIGLVQELVEPGDEFTCALSIARRIASAAPLGVAATLRSALTARLHGPRPALEQLYDEAAKICRTADAGVGIATYLDRARPTFVGN